MQAIHKTTLDKFDEVNKALTVEIFSAVKKAIKQMTKMISRAQEESDLKSKGMNIELQRLIHSKASVVDLEQLAETKTNKVDTEIVMDSVCTIHKMLKQGFVLINDSLKSPLETPTETAISKENRQKYLLNQMTFLIKWILNYNPSSSNPTTQGENNDFLKDNSEGKNLQQYTNMLMREAQSISHINLSNIPVNIRQKTLNNEFAVRIMLILIDLFRCMNKSLETLKACLAWLIIIKSLSLAPCPLLVILTKINRKNLSHQSLTQ